MMRFFLFSMFSVFLLHGKAYFQSKNLVPNPGFEEYVDVPDRWYYNGEHFTEIVKFWSSPTPASPDAYGSKIRVPREWKEKGFGKQKPHTGQNMVGITVYGCEGGKPHCREYIQIRLTESLVVGQKYEISLWVGHLRGAYFSNNIGIVFSESELYGDLDARLEAMPQINIPELVIPPLNGWGELTFEYTADQAYEFMTIGNFFEDRDTKSAQATSGLLPFAYYYLDDVSVGKIKPILPVPKESNFLDTVQISSGSKFHLDKIFFDYDRADFLARSYVQLDALFLLLDSREDIHIEIQGHTDNTGDNQYNDQLSLERAKAVVDYLLQRGISVKRLQYKGFGSTQPIATNDTYMGRKQNRRVEFLVTQLSENH